MNRLNQKQLQSEQTRKRIAEAARTLFIQKGYKATSIEDIVSATGSSKGNIYYHFKNKEGLFLYLMEEWDREWEQNWESNAHTYPTSVGKLYGLAEQLAADELNHPMTKVADEFFRQQEKTSDAEAKIAEMIARHLDFNRKLLQEGMERGEFAEGDAKQTAYVLEALLFGVSQMSRSIEREQLMQVFRDAVHIFLHGIVADGSAPRS